MASKNGKGHGIHSPFVFEFVKQVLNDTQNYYCYAPIENCRQLFLKNSEIIEVQDFGAGSRRGLSNQRSISAIAASSLKPKKYGQLLFRMANFYGAETIVELGTSLGITTAYLASANSKGKVISLEGSDNVAKIAAENIAGLGIKNAEIITGNFDDTLPEVLKKAGQVDLVYVDGNHRKTPTLQYFQQLMAAKNDRTILVFDDIHWSKDMEEAWEIIKADDRVMLTIDLFFIGIVFFRQEFKVKQHFSIRF